MRSKWLLICCLILTTIVVCTACRIEYLNVTSGYFLPRQHSADVTTLDKWVIPELDKVLERIEDQFYERRQGTAAVEASENGDAIPAEVSAGPPYSANEQRIVDSMKNLHDSHTKLHWWVSSFGVAQYFLAPLSLLIAIVCAVALSGWGLKATASLCACLSGSSILLMLTRSYWQALGA